MNLQRKNKKTPISQKGTDKNPSVSLTVFCLKEVHEFFSTFLRLKNTERNDRMSKDETTMLKVDGLSAVEGTHADKQLDELSVEVGNGLVIEPATQSSVANWLVENDSDAHDEGDNNPTDDNTGAANCPIGIKHLVIDKNKMLQFLRDFFAGAQSTDNFKLQVWSAEQPKMKECFCPISDLSLSADEFLAKVDKVFSAEKIKEIAFTPCTYQKDNPNDLIAIPLIVDNVADIDSVLAKITYKPSIVVASGATHYLLWKFKTPIRLDVDGRALELAKEFAEFVKSQIKYDGVVTVPRSVKVGVSVPGLKEAFGEVQARIGGASYPRSELENLVFADELSTLYEEIQSDSDKGGDKEFEESLKPAESVDYHKAKAKSFAQIEFVLIERMLKKPSEIDTVAKIIDAAAFDNLSARLAYNHIKKSYEDGLPLDLITLPSQMISGSMDDAVKKDAVIFLEQLQAVEGVIGTEQLQAVDVKTYAKLLKKRQIERASKKLADDIEKFNAEHRGKFSGAEFYRRFSERFKHLEEEVQRGNDSDAGGLKFVTAKEYFQNEWMSDIEERRKYAEKPTGFKYLDDYQVFMPAMYVVGGLPATGKTTFVWQMLNQVAEQGSEAVFVSCEMSYHEIIPKNLARLCFAEDSNTTLTSTDIMLGAKSPALSRALEIAKKSPVKFVDGTGTTLENILDFLRSNCDFTRTPVIAFDYLQILQTELNSAEREVSNKMKVDYVLKLLKEFKDETNSRVILISSLNRSSYTLSNAPMAAFKESGDIEYYANVLWILSKANDDTQNGNGNVREINLTCLKNRSGAGNYVAGFTYHAAHDTFINTDCGFPKGNNKNDSPKSKSGTGRKRATVTEDNYNFDEEDNYR